VVLGMRAAAIDAVTAGGASPDKLGFHGGKVAIERPWCVPAAMMRSCCSRVGEAA
jgi:hypothetical protein